MTASPNRWGFFMPMKKYLPFKTELTKLAKDSNQTHLIDHLIDLERQGKCMSFSHPELGLLVVKPMADTLFVWIAITRIKDGFETGLPFVIELAKQSNCSSITFETHRTAFKRFAPKYGFRLVGQRNQFLIFNKEV